MTAPDWSAQSCNLESPFGYIRDAFFGEIEIRNPGLDHNQSALCDGWITTLTPRGLLPLPAEAGSCASLVAAPLVDDLSGSLTAIGGFFPGRQRTFMELFDRALTCIDCGGEFVFSAGEQLFFQLKQFQHEPKRCPPCRAKYRPAARAARHETRTTCSNCGMETTVPFTPRQGRPVLCRPCFQKK